MFQKGDEHRKQLQMTDDLCLKIEEIKLSNNTTEMTNLDKKILKEGHQGQGNMMIFTSYIPMREVFFIISHKMVNSKTLFEVVSCFMTSMLSIGALNSI